MARIVTVVMKIEDMEQAKAIWAAHGAGKTLLGGTIKSIANGDKTAECDRLTDLLHEANQEAAEKHEDGWPTTND